MIEINRGDVKISGEFNIIIAEFTTGIYSFSDELDMTAEELVELISSGIKASRLMEAGMTVEEVHSILNNEEDKQ